MFPSRIIWLQYLLIYFLTLAYKDIIPLLGSVLPFMFMIDFVRNLGKKIPIRELILLTISIQCMFVPALYYMNLLEIPEIYEMAIPETEYFGYIVPAFLLFGAGINLGKEPAYTIVIEDYDQFFRVGRVLIIVGIIGDFVVPFTPGGMGFFVLLISHLKFIGAIYVLFSGNRYYTIWVGLAFINIFINSLTNALFQELLGWSMFFILYYFYRKRTSLFNQVAIIAVLLIGIFILQHIKGGYRMSIEEKKINTSVEDKVNTFVDQYIESSTSEETFSDESLNNNFVRFNQGYIIGRIMDHVPQHEPYADGETIRDAIYSSLVPRFLDPGKTTVGGVNGLYSRFTGFELIKGTSKDLSIFGEIYANFGTEGGIYMSLMVGLFYNLFITILIRACRNDPQFIFWIPYLFLIMVRPENSFVAVLNHYTKAALVLYLLHVFYLRKQYLKLHFKSILT